MMDKREAFEVAASDEVWFSHIEYRNGSYTAKDPYVALSDGQASRANLMLKGWNAALAHQEPAGEPVGEVVANNGKNFVHWKSTDEWCNWLDDAEPGTKLHTAQPANQDRWIQLAACLYQACGAYDMPERILDVLSLAQRGEDFSHLLDGLLPCCPQPGE